MLEDQGVVVSYLPSVRLGADLAGRAKEQKSRTDSRVLVVGYDGEDMPGQDHEVASMQAIWSTRLTVLPGKECTKASVIKELNKPYHSFTSYVTDHSTKISLLNRRYIFARTVRKIPAG